MCAGNFRMLTPPTLVSVAFSASSGDLAVGPFTATVTADVTDSNPATSVTA